jgi:hypothetical protein
MFDKDASNGQRAQRRHTVMGGDGRQIRGKIYLSPVLLF